ncbi:MAG: hypothetical protein IKL08_00585 [Clostridia bacterium]|nr:hypothetical protein [Clostridia bacterium]
MRMKKGISLIVLVITIIIMVILAANVVITLSKTGIIDDANTARLKNDIKIFLLDAKNELILMQENATLNSESEKEAYINRLKENGYEIEKVENSETIINDVILSDDGNKIEKIAVRSNLEKEVLIDINEKVGTRYYLKLLGKYYEIDLSKNNDVELSLEPLLELPNGDDLTGVWITPTTSDIITLIDGKKIIDEIQIMNDTKVVFKANSDSGNSNFKIKYSDVEKTYEVDIVMNAEDIKINPKAYYGKNIINYKQIDGYTGAMEILVSDSENVYIITEDGVENNISVDGYNGTIDFVNDQHLPIGERRFPSIDKWLYGMMDAIKNDGFALAEDNIRAAEFLLDKNNWNEYMDERICEYAIGGPTIELFSVALGDCGYDPIEFKIEDYGYTMTNYRQVGWCQSTYALKHSGAYFMASPAHYTFMRIAYLHSVDSYVESYYYDYILRPVVCLKDSALLKYNSSTSSFEIYNY